MRKQKSIINISYNLIFFLLNSLLTFISRTVMISCIGADYTGLASICRSIVGMLNIAELGISSAVTYSLYKPLRNKEYEKINSIMNTYKYLYRIIGLVVLILSTILTFFTDIFIHSQSISSISIKIYFFVFSLITVLSYFITYPQVLANADQKSYIVSKIDGIINTLKIIAQIIILIIFKNYILWITIEVLFMIYIYTCTNKKIKEIYPWLNVNKKINLKENIKHNKDIINDTKNIFVHKLAYTIGYQTDNVIISTFTNLMELTIYTNYTIIINILRKIASMIINGLRSSIGDLIAEGNDKKSFDIWYQISIILNYMSTVIVFCTYININNLVTVWLGHSFLINQATILIMCIILYIQMSIFDIIEMFKNGYGLFDDLWAPIVEGVVNLVLSLILVNYFGIVGVLLGTLVSMLVVALWWKPYIVFKCGFKISILNYIKVICKNLFITIMSMFLAKFILSKLVLDCKITIIRFSINCIISLVSISLSYYIISLFDYKHRELYCKIKLSLNKFKVKIVKIMS